MAVHNQWLTIDDKIRDRGLRWGRSNHDRSPTREQVIGDKVIKHSRQNELPKAVRK